MNSSTSAFTRLVVPIVASVLANASISAAPDPKAEVIVNVSMTAEGRKVPRPSPEHPAYYVPVIPGWQEDGKIVAGEQPPPRGELLGIMHRELAKQGYLFVPDPKVKPSLILAFEWGYLNPVVHTSGATSLKQIMDFLAGNVGGDADPVPPDIGLNEEDMYRLIFGDGSGKLESMPRGYSDRLQDATTHDRYFMIVTAFDFEAAKKNEKEILWRARMSTPRQGVWLNEVMGTLIAAGAPLFGRETTMPQISTGPIAPRGKVEVGATEVVEHEVPAKSRSPKTKP